MSRCRRAERSYGLSSKAQEAMVCKTSSKYILLHQVCPCVTTGPLSPSPSHTSTTGNQQSQTDLTNTHVCTYTHTHMRTYIETCVDCMYMRTCWGDSHYIHSDYIHSHFTLYYGCAVCLDYSTFIPFWTFIL